MAAGFLLSLALTEAETISTTPGLCKRVRYRQSECRKCVDSCPEDAITIDPAPRINEACTQCSLCVNVCPTEVFQHGFSMDQYLLDQINSLIGKNHTPKSKKSFHIHCQQAEKPDAGSHRVACSGNITENVIMGGALLGLDELVLARGKCSQCRLPRGEALFREAITTFRVSKQSLGLKGFELRLEEKQKDRDKEIKLSRRAFFSSIAQPVKDKSGPARYAVDDSALEASNDEPISQFDTRPSPKRESLRELLRQQNWRNGVPNLHGESPWQTMKVDEKNCIGCGICVAVCPTGALRKEYGNNQLIRYFNSALCSNCSLCEEACPKQVISFEAANNIASFIEDTTTVVARIDLTSCTICGETIPQTEGEVCITCQKRQLTPLFI
ncbi:MAG: 4Fe-4S binding protein [Gammaproteobacteria bacterium]|nr:4Fe-4S binding protein [Gammaproteobacteria bacterium]